MPRLHLDLSCGVSGDMLLAALAHATNGFDRLEQGLASLGLDCFRLETTKPKVAGIVTRHIEVVQTKEQPLRHLSHLLDIVAKADIPEPVRETSAQAFTLLAEAEAEVHGSTVDKIHFHEVGAVDTVVDVVGTALLVHSLAPDTVSCSPVNLGSGFVNICHGRLPVPAPAVAELAKGVPVFATDMGMEAATPTGMALVRVLAREFGPLPLGRLTSVGYGSGTYSSDATPTYVRAFVYET